MVAEHKIQLAELPVETFDALEKQLTVIQKILESIPPAHANVAIHMVDIFLQKHADIVESQTRKKYSATPPRKRARTDKDPGRDARDTSPVASDTDVDAARADPKPVPASNPSPRSQPQKRKLPDSNSHDLTQESSEDDEEDQDTNPDTTVLPAKSTRQKGKGQDARKRKKKDTSGSDVVPFNPNPQYPVELQHGLVDDLLGFDVSSIKVKAGGSTTPFSAKDANQVTAFFFNNVSSLPGLERLNTLLEEYSQSMKATGGLVITSRAFSIAEGESIPDAARPVFEAYGQLQKSLSRGGEHLQSFYTLIERVNMVDAYHRLVAVVDDVEKKPGVFNQELSDKFRAEGFKPSQGRAWNSAVIDFMAAKLEAKRVTVQERIHQSAGIHSMVTNFGFGCLALVPQNMANMIMRWQHLRMQSAWPLIDQRFPAFREICQWVEENITAPIRAGLECTVTKIDISENGKPVIQRLQEAGRITDGGRITEAEESAVE